MLSMESHMGVDDVSAVLLPELWNQVAIQAMELVRETRDVVIEKDSFQEFSSSISELNTLLQALNVQKVEAAMGSEFSKNSLDTLNWQLSEVQKIINNYRSGSRFLLLLHSNSLLSQMEGLAKEIARTISSLQLVNLDLPLSLKTMTIQIIDNLSSMKFRSAVTTETIASEIENSISWNGRNRENAVRLLEKVAVAVGVSANEAFVQNELAVLKQEKEEMEAQNKQAEAFQLAQLIKLLYTTEMVMRPQHEQIAAYQQQHPIDSFICPLSNVMMTDPVAISCGHSFERKAIQKYFSTGKKNCPTCKEELSSTELTLNVILRSFIEEWKQRDMDLMFEAAITGISSDCYPRKIKSLEDMHPLMEQSRYAIKAAEEGIIPKLVESLKDNTQNTIAALKCLSCVAKYCDDYKEAIVEAGAVRRIVKLICQGKAEADATEVLFELSKKETLGEKLGNTKDCIPLLVSMINSNNPDVSQKVQKVLQNLSSNTHFVVKMAEAGYFQPFVARFSEGPQETRALMAAALVNMQLKENNIKDLKDKQFIHNLVQMLASNSPAFKSACFKCIKKLIAFPKMVKRLLSDPATIPLLLGLISFVRCDPSLKQEAAEILALFVAACQHPQFLMHQGLQELQSNHNISLFLHSVATVDPQTKIQFLHLLVELSYKSERARDLIHSNADAITHLFSSLESDPPAVKRWAMKLIYCISECHPVGVPLPPSPGKETAINTLACILTCSPDAEERSIAAGIISQLPKEDVIIDEILCKSEVLGAIRNVICRTDDELIGITAPAEEATSLLENALAALLRFTEPTKPELQRQIGKFELYPSLVRLLSSGSSLAKQRTAIALAQLSQSTSHSISHATVMAQQSRSSMPLLQMTRLLPNLPRFCCSVSTENEISCPVHGAACSPRNTFCLVKADAVKPLVRTLSDTESSVTEAALMALETLLIDHSTVSRATGVIMDSQGVVAILQVLEKGSLSAKRKALDLLQRILNHTEITDKLFSRSERILIQLLHDDALKKKAALVLRQMNVIPEQSSYF